MRSLYGLFIPVLLLAAIALAAPPVHAAATPPPDDDRTIVQPSALERPADAVAPTDALSPMMVEIEQLLADQKTAVEALRSQLAEAVGADRKIELLQAIHRLKSETEVNILRVQLSYAEREGRVEQVRQLEEAIAYLTSPRPVPPPQPRPAPDRTH